MAKYMVVLTVYVLSVHAAQFYSKDAYSRIARSPYYYGPDGPPLPPPPPPGPPPPPVFFRTKNWSGLARRADGSTQGVFSGAAAAADSLPTSGAAYSLASSGVTGSGSCCGQSGQADFGGQSSGNSGSYGGQSSQYNGQLSNRGTDFSQSNGDFSGGQQSSKSLKESHFAYQSGGKQFDSQGNQESNAVISGYSSAQSSALAGNTGGSSHSHDIESFGDQQQLQQTRNLNSGSQGFSDGQQQVQLDSHFNEHTHGKHQVGFNDQAKTGANKDAAQIQQQSSDFGRSNSQSFEGSNSGGFSSSSSQAGAFRASGSHQHNEAIRGNIGESKGQFNKPGPLTSSYGASSGQIKESGSFGAGSVGGQSAKGGGFTESQQSGSSSGALNSGYTGSTGGSFGDEDLQSTLGGALNLASQGLQASEKSGCSTCGKSNYALSNAKSHSGSAVALSLGG